MTEDAEDARARRWRHFRNVRIAVLLSVLVLTAGTIELRLRRIRSWDRVLVVGIYPVAASTAPEVRPYIDSLREQDFTPIVTFLEREARRYGRSFSPPLVQIRLSKPVPEPPPVLADDPGALDVIRWSLALRLYSWRMHRDHGLPDADVELYTLFHAAGSPHALDTSLALSRTVYKPNQADPNQRTTLGTEQIPITGAETIFGPKAMAAELPKIPRWTATVGFTRDGLAASTNCYQPAALLDYRITNRYGVTAGAVNKGALLGLSVRFGGPK